MCPSTERSGNNHLTHITVPAQGVSLQGFMGVTWVVRWVIRVKCTRVCNAGAPDMTMTIWSVAASTMTGTGMERVLAELGDCQTLNCEVLK